MGGSFLGGWLAGDLATRGPDRGAEADKLSGELHNERNQLQIERHQLDAERQNAENSHEVSMASMSAVGAAVGAVVSWKSLAHGMRARLNARRETEEELLEQLTAADVRVPLGNPSDFGRRVDERYVENFTNPAVIEETFENGQIPPAAREEFEEWKKEKGIE